MPVLAPHHPGRVVLVVCREASDDLQVVIGGEWHDQAGEVPVEGSYLLDYAVAYCMGVPLSLVLVKRKEAFHRLVNVRSVFTISYFSSSFFSLVCIRTLLHNLANLLGAEASTWGIFLWAFRGSPYAHGGPLQCRLVSRGVRIYYNAARVGACLWRTPLLLPPSRPVHNSSLRLELLRLFASCKFEYSWEIVSH